MEAVAWLIAVKKMTRRHTGALDAFAVQTGFSRRRSHLAPPMNGGVDESHLAARRIPSCAHCEKSVAKRVGKRAWACYIGRPLGTDSGLKFTRKNRNLVMSQHRSLRAAATLGGKRNVLKRFERLELLKKRGQWKPGERITGLRKTKGEA